jgi:hypothetical protein
MSARNDILDEFPCFPNRPSVQETRAPGTSPERGRP